MYKEGGFDMPILRWSPTQTGYGNPWREMERLRNHFENLMENFSGGGTSPLRRGAGVYPPLNLAEDTDNLYLTAELPGVRPEDLDLSVEGDGLILRGERTIAETDKKVNYHRREREAGTFRRIVSLPVKVDAEKVSAKFRNGVLTATLPKAPEAKARQIDIQAE
jgi:HSP20 family protein